MWKPPQAVYPSRIPARFAARSFSSRSRPEGTMVAVSEMPSCALSYGSFATSVRAVGVF